MKELENFIVYLSELQSSDSSNNRNDLFRKISDYLFNGAGRDLIESVYSKKIQVCFIDFFFHFISQGVK